MRRSFFRWRLIGRLLLRYTVVWFADATSIAVTALVMPGIYFLREAPFWFLQPFTAALLFGLLNALVRPVLVLLLLPITFVTLGLATLALNAALFYLMTAILHAFVIESFVAAVTGVLVLTLVNTLLGNLLQLRDDYSFYAKLMNRLSTLTRPRQVDLSEGGVILLQIDGLSYAALKEALRRGKMPFVGTQLRQRRYTLRKWFSGLPSQTSAVQSGVFYGSTYDIPGFRWYDKRAGRMVVSSSATDMRALDERLGAEARSILEQGSCINSLLHGNALKKLLTVSSLTDKDIKQHRAELEDFAIFTLHPYLYTRTILVMIWDFLVDRFETALELIRRKRPRLSRSVKFSFYRSIGNACLREITSFFVREDIVRGIPVIYANYLGYDMVAHYTGPYSNDALNTLGGIDRQIRRIHRVIRRESAHPYRLIVLSDHGQSPSVPFTSLYEKPLEAAIQDRLDRPVDTAGHRAELGYVDALLREIRFVEEAYGTRPIRGSRRTLERLHASMTRDDPAGEVTEHGERVVVCPSGCLAHVYFTDVAARMTTEELFEQHRGLLEYLVGHSGIGFVVTTNAEGEPLMMGRHGLRRLSSNRVDGRDPLEQYASGRERERVIDALLTMCRYPSAGDIILNGAKLDDGRIVTFEEQLGTHGGLGGEQTAPFFFYPGRFRRKEDRVGDPIELHAFLRRLLGGSQAVRTP